MTLYHQHDDTGGGSHKCVWDQVGIWARGREQSHNS